jgi:putative phosphoribosyl transferase
VSLLEPEPGRADRPQIDGATHAFGQGATGHTQVVGMKMDVIHPRRAYRDRNDAGQVLAAALDDYKHRPDVQVFAIPRGGVPVAYEVARQLVAPLDVVVVRKLGLPFQPELAMGAIASGGVRVLNPDVVDLGLPPRIIDSVASRELKELARRERAYRGQRPALDPRGHSVIVVDDGLATGSSMRAAIASLRARGAASVVVAVPVGPDSTCEEIAGEADRLVCPLRPHNFLGVGEWFADFSQTTDEEVRQLLESADYLARAMPSR